jgi:MYXO-CTERM domain-containing protein
MGDMGIGNRGALTVGLSCAALGLLLAAPAAAQRRTSFAELRRAPHAASFIAEGDYLLAVASSGRAKPARVELPQRLPNPTRITDPASGMSVGFVLAGASADSQLSYGTGLGVYDHPLGAGTELAESVRGSGVEDFVRLSHEVPGNALAYHVDVSHAAGLRLVGGALELLDAGGAPRLRVLAPFISDAHDEHHTAHLSVRGCAVDKSPAAPWHRPVTPPGSGTCTLVVSWDAGLPYPILVDPFWTNTVDLAHERAEHVAVKLKDGTVLVAGGEYYAVGVQPAELYDDTSGTWAETGTPTNSRSLARTLLLDDGRVFTAGRDQSCDIYDPATGKFTAAADMSTLRSDFGMAKLGDGRVIAVGGYAYVPSQLSSRAVASAEIYDPAQDTWTDTTSMSEARRAVSATTLPDGRVIAIGGDNFGKVSNTAEIYDPTTAKWTLTPPMASTHRFHHALLLADGLVAVAGGDSSHTDFYDPKANTWRAGTPLSNYYDDSGAVALPDSSLLLVGGSGGGVMKATEVLTAATGHASYAGDMNQARYHTTATLLSSDLLNARVLVVGGYENSSSLHGTNTAEIRDAKLRGFSCSTAADCLTGACVEGVCCDSHCDTGCVSCLMVEQGVTGTDGECGPVREGTDPHNDCQDDGAQSCDQNGDCDGKGACEIYPADTICGTEFCKAGVAYTYRCDGKSACVESFQDCIQMQCAGSTCASNASGGSSGTGASGGFSGNGGFSGSGAYSGNGGGSGYSGSAATPASNSSSGCACSTGTGPDAGGLFALMALCFAAVERRRRH